MSREALEWACGQMDIRGMRKLVLTMISWRDNHKTHCCFPSLATIARDCGINKATVARHLNSLERSGKISRQRRPSHHGDSETTVYRFPQVEYQVVALCDSPGSIAQQPVVAQSDRELTNYLTHQRTKPRAQTRSARDSFDAKMERLRREAEVKRELHVG